MYLLKCSIKSFVKFGIIIKLWWSCWLLVAHWDVANILLHKKLNGWPPPCSYHDDNIILRLFWVLQLYNVIQYLHCFWFELITLLSECDKSENGYFTWLPY